MASAREIEAGRAFVRLFLKNDLAKQLTKALNKAGKQLRSFGASTMQIGASVAAAGAAMAAPFALATKTFANFDDAMREVAGATQATADQLASLTAEAKRLGASTSFAASEVALLMAELGRANFSPREIEAMTGSVLALARATKTEAAQSAGIMATALRQFALDAGDASRVADVLTAGANKSFNTLDTLGESLSYAGPVANDFNMSLEDTVAILGTLGNVGIQGSKAGTALRRMLTLTGAEADKLKGIFGVSFVDDARNARPLVDALDDVAKATANLGTAERAKKFNEAFGLLGITGASAIAKNIAGTRELREEIEKAGGVAQKTAEMMDSGLGGAFRILKSAVEGVQIAIGEALGPTITRLTKWLTDAAQAAIAWVQENRGIIVIAASVAGGLIAAGTALLGIGAAIWAVGAALTTAGTLIAGAMAVVGATVSTLVAVFGFLLSPVGLLTAALVGGVAAWARYSEGGQNAVNAMKGGVLAAFDTLKTAFGGITDALASGDWALAGQIAMSGLKLAFFQGLAAIQEAFPATFNTVIRAVGWAGDQIVKAWDYVTGFLSEQWNSWGRQTLETIVTVAKEWKRIWKDTVKDIANWMLETSAKGGVAGKVMSKILGVDMLEEQKRAEKYERELAALQGRKAGEVDVVADAKAEVDRLVESWGGEPTASKGITPGTGAVSSQIEEFLGGLASGGKAAEAKAELDRLMAEASKQRQQAEQERQAVAAAGGAAAAGAAGGAAAVGASRGVALTATYSAAAAQISGYQPAGPEQQMANGIQAIERNTAEMTRQQQEFLAGWRVA